MVTLNFNITKENYIKLNLDTLKIPYGIGRTMRIRRYGFPIMYLLLPIAGWKLTTIGFKYWITCYAIGALLWMIFFPIIFKKQVINNIEKSFKDGKFKEILGKHTITFYDDGFSHLSKLGKEKILWRNVEKFLNGQDNIYIYKNANNAYIVPKSSFINNEQEEMVLNLLKNKVLNK